MSIFGSSSYWVRVSTLGICAVGLVALMSLSAGPCLAGQGPAGAQEDGARGPATDTAVADSASSPAGKDGDSWEDSIMLPEIMDRLQKILPEFWEVLSIEHKQTPRKWAGSPEAVLIRLENPTITAYQPTGLEYHPFFRIWLCPTVWRGRVDDVRYREDGDWPVLLGQNHKMKVFYLSQGYNDWTDGPALLRQMLDLTSLPISRSLRRKIDPEMMLKVSPKLADAGSSLPGVRERLIGLEKEGPLAYVEYATSTVPKDRKPDQVVLSRCDEPDVVWMMERENQSLARVILLAYPEVHTVYVRRVCDEFASDRVIDRSEIFPKDPMALSSPPDPTD